MREKITTAALKIWLRERARECSQESHELYCSIQEGCVNQDDDAGQEAYRQEGMAEAFRETLKKLEEKT